MSEQLEKLEDAQNLEMINLKGDKPKDKFRKYLEKTSVSEFYRKNHEVQTYEYVQKIKSEVLPIGRFGEHNIFEILKYIDEIVDHSDPDNKKPQIIHALQTGEACKKFYPDKDWFHLLGFIHDLGKVIAHPKMYNFPQWAVVGDTFPVGCAFNNQCVFPEYFQSNPDYFNEKYNTKFGIYEENIGFDNLSFSWGHDEYLYQVLKNNKNKLPEEALYVIRYHSFYPWHQSGAYSYLASKKDEEYLKYLKDFQVCDLYSKKEEVFNVDDYLPYYLGLIEKYFPSPILAW
jgi:inositol oxygenase